MSNSSDILHERRELLRPSEQLKCLVNKVRPEIKCLSISGQFFVFPSALESCAETIEANAQSNLFGTRVSAGTYTDSNSKTVPKDWGDVSGSASKWRRARYS